MQQKKMREEKKSNQTKYNQQIAHIKGSNCFGFVSIWTQSNQPNAYMCIFFVRLILWLCIASQLNVRLIFRLWLFTPFGKKKTTAMMNAPSTWWIISIWDKSLQNQFSNNNTRSIQNLHSYSYAVCKWCSASVSVTHALLTAFHTSRLKCPRWFCLIFVTFWFVCSKGNECQIGQNVT